MRISIINTKFLLVAAVICFSLSASAQPQPPPAPPPGAFQPPAQPQFNQAQMNQPNNNYNAQQQQYNYAQQQQNFYAPQQQNLNGARVNVGVRGTEIDYNQNMATLMAQNNLECSSIYRNDNTGVPQNPLLIPINPPSHRN